MNETKMENQSDEKKALGGRNSGRRKKILVLAGLVAGLVLMVVGYRMYLQLISHESTEDAFVEAHVVTISPKVAGHVARVPVIDNQKVDKGDLLAEVDPRDFQVALDIAQAQLQSANASKKEAEALVAVARNTLAQKKASLNSSLASMAQAEAGVAEVRASYDRDEQDLQRSKRMANVGAVSRQEYDHAQAEASMSKAKLNSAQKQVDTANAQIVQAKAAVSGAENELRQAEAQVDVRMSEMQEAEAAVQQAKLNLSYTRIVAPCAGFVTKKSVEPGAYVQVGQKLMAVVGEDSWIVANFKETQISDMRKGQPVDIEVDAYPDVIFTGKVDSIQRGTGSRFTLLPPENASGNFIKVVQRVPVKIVLTHGKSIGEYLLAPGMSVIPTVNIRSNPNAAALSSSRHDKLATAVQ